jgi:uncharacterized protein YlzI (FlbEa/FlbD family)
MKIDCTNASNWRPLGAWEQADASMTRRNHFISLTRLDGSPVWIAADKIERVHADGDGRTGAIVHFDSGEYISVLETPAQVMQIVP